MARDSQGMRFLDRLKIGLDELQWWQDNQAERAAWFRAGVAHEAGFVADWNGPAGNIGWDITDGGSGLLEVGESGTTQIDRTYPDAARTRPFVAVDRDGNVLEITRGPIYDDTGAQIDVPNDGVWRTLVCRYATRQRAPGTLTLTAASTTVVGVGTQFTRYADATDEGQATRIRIDPDDTSAGNEGSYAFATITDDENATLDLPAIATEDGVSFRVRGTFFGAAPADPDARREAYVTWELVTRTTTRPTDGLIAYDVMSSGGVVSLIDRRRGSIFQPFTGQNVSFSLSDASRTFYYYTGAEEMFDPEYVLLGAVTGTLQTVAALAMAPASTGGHLPGQDDAPTGLLLAIAYETDSPLYAVRVKEHSPLVGWDDPDGAGTVDVVSGVAAITDVALVALPSGSGFTHLCYYVQGGDLYSKTSDDNGATWVGPDLVASFGSNITRVSACLTRMNRLVLVLKCSAGNPIRVLYSDDLGDTYDDDAGSGYDFGAGDASTTLDVHVVEDDRGNLWTLTGWDDTVNSSLVVYRGAGEGDAVPAAAGWPVGQVMPSAGPGPYDSTVYNTESVDGVALPNGHVVAIHDALKAATSRGNRTFGTVVARRRALATYKVAHGTDKTDTDRCCPVAAALSSNGELFVAFCCVDTLDWKVYVRRYGVSVNHRPFAVYGTDG